MKSYKLILLLLYCVLLANCGGGSDTIGQSENAGTGSETNNPPPSSPPPPSNNPPPPPDVIFEGPTSSTSPFLYFSDLKIGPRLGNSDTSLGQTAGENGAIVSVYGRNLSGNVTITMGGAVVEHVYYKGPAEPPYSPANLFLSHLMDMIIFQVPGTAPLGSTSIQVAANNETSNALSFTVKDSGNIYFVKTTGSSAGDGSFNNPYSDLRQVVGLANPGDTIYPGEGINVTDANGGFNSIINLTEHGTAESPIAMVAYPGATVNIGRIDWGRALHNWVSGAGDNRANGWVIAKINIISNSCGVKTSEYTRIIGNYFTGPQATGATGMICMQDNSSHSRIYGNEFFNVGAPNASKLYHVVYVKSTRSSSGPRLPTETDKIIGFNYFHDNRANRAINIYSEQSSTAFAEGHIVHDNYIVNQYGDGIYLGWYTTGENWVFNNVVINFGLDLPSFGGTGHSGISLRDAGHNEVATNTIHVYHNTVYGGEWNPLPSNAGSIYFSDSTVNRVNVDMKNNIFYSTGEPYFSGGGANSVPVADYNNLYFGHPNVPASDTAAINVDPMFVNIDIGNARLSTGSLAIDQGVDVPDVQRDILGEPRVSGTYDVGAYEQ